MYTKLESIEMYVAFFTSFVRNFLSVCVSRPVGREGSRRGGPVATEQRYATDSLPHSPHLRLRGLCPRLGPVKANKPPHCWDTYDASPIHRALRIVCFPKNRNKYNRNKNLKRTQQITKKRVIMTTFEKSNTPL